MSLTTGIIIAIIVIIIAIIFFVLSAKRISFHRNHALANDNSQIYVGNLPYRINQSALQDYFSRYGHIREIRIVKDKHTGRSKGFGFVTFATEKEAQQALQAHGQDLNGRSIVVRIAKSRP